MGAGGSGGSSDPNGGMYGVYVGAGRNDGVQRVYASNANGTQRDGQIYEFTWTGSTWSKAVVGIGATNWGMDQVVVGNGRNDGTQRVYGGNLDGFLYEFSWTGSAWSRSQIDLGVGLSGTYFPVIGAGRNDGVQRLYVGNDNFGIYELTWTGSAWSEVKIGVGTRYGRGVALGPGRSDGVNREYAIAGSGFEFSWNGSNWTSTNIGGSGLPVPGLGRNTTTEYLYAADSGGVHESSWTGTAWAPQTMIASAAGNALVIGAGRNDGVKRIYSAGSDGSVYEVSQGPPSLATGISAASRTTGTITWSWTDNSGGTSGFRVLSSSGASLSGDLPAGTVSWQQTGLSTNTASTIAVAAFDFGGASTSALVTANTLAAPPASFAVTAVSSFSVSLSWSANSNPIGTNYQLDYWNAGGSTTSVSSAGFAATVAGLLPRTSYYFQLAGKNGDGILTNEVQASMMTTGPPAPPANVSASSRTTTSITWSWTDPSGGTSGFRVLASNGAPLSGDLAAGTTYWQQTGFSTNTVSSVEVAAFDSGGASTSSLVSAYTLAAPATGFAVTAVSSFSVSLQWSANSNPGGTSYRFDYWKAGGSTTSSVGAGLTATATGLSPRTSYYFQIAARNGDGLLSSESRASVVTLGAPAPPGGVFASSKAATSITWCWADASGGTSGFRVLSTSGTSLSGDLAGGTTCWQQVGLSTNTASAVQVAAFDYGGVSTSAATAAYTLAAVPAGFAATAVSSYSASLQWSADSNPNGTSYQLDYWKAGSSTTSITGAGLAATINDLSPRTSYYFQVAARNGDGLMTGEVRISTLTKPEPNYVSPTTDTMYVATDGTHVELQAGAVSSAAFVLVGQPASSPPAVTDPKVKGTSLIRQITLSDGTHQLNKSVVVRVPYTAGDIAGLDESSLRLFTYDDARGVWVLTSNSAVDTSGKLVSGQVNHFSLFQVMAITLSGAAVDDLTNYPNPFSPLRGQTTKIHYLLASDQDARIRIFDPFGGLVWDTTYAAGQTGGQAGPNDVTWDGTTGGGRRVSMGAYICVVESGGAKIKTRIGVK